MTASHTPVPKWWQLRTRLRNWVDSYAKSRCPDTAAELTDRWWFYRFLDIVLMKIHFRYVPPECQLEHLGVVPPSGNLNSEGGHGKYWEVWQAIYDNALRLVMHDDALNWQKYHYMIVLHTGLFTVYTYILQQKSWHLGALSLSMLGLLFAWLFDRTMQEGMRCLRAHRQKVKVLDGKLFQVETTEFLFRANPYNQRDALEIGPIALFVIWLFMAAYALYKICSDIPENPWVSRIS